MPVKRCPTSDELKTYAYGTLAVGLAEEVTKHLADCESCEDTVQQLSAASVDRMRDLVNAQSVPQPYVDEPACGQAVESIKRCAPPEGAGSHERSAPDGKPAEGKAVAHLDRAAFVEFLTQAGFVATADIASIEKQLPAEKRNDVPALAQALIQLGKLTKFQAATVYQGHGKSLSYGDYLVLDRIGSGGMGQVYKARHRRLDRIVALKVLSSTAMRNADSVKRFEREARAAAKLVHPNIVHTYDAGAHDDTHYLVMEYVAGTDMSSLIRKQGKLPLSQGCDFIAQAARGLAYAHAQGIVHRDVKPSNLLVDPAGAVKVLDMGLARFDAEVGAASTERELTQTGAVMGTIDYMAPEQALNTSRADAKSDVYGLGCTLYRILTGTNAFGGETMVEKILAHREHPIPPLCKARPDAPPALEAFLGRMLSKKPDQRPTMQETADTLATVLTAVSNTMPSLPQAVRSNARAPSVAGPMQTATAHASQMPPKRRSPLVLVGAAGAAGLLILGGVLFVIRDKDGNKLAEVNAPDGSSVTASVVPSATAPAPIATQTTASKPTPVAVTKVDEPTPATITTTTVNPTIPAPFATAAAPRSRSRVPLPPALGSELPPAEQLLAINRKLSETNGKPVQARNPVFGDEGIVELEFNNADLTDITPLTGLPLRRLSLYNNKNLAGDLTALRGMPLEELNLQYCAKLTSIRGLEGAPLKKLNLYQCESIAGDLSLLRGSEIASLNVRYCYELTSLEGIQALPIVELDIHDCRKLTVADHQIIAGLKTLQKLTTGKPDLDAGLLSAAQSGRGLPGIPAAAPAATPATTTTATTPAAASAAEPAPNRSAATEPLIFEFQPLAQEVMTGGNPTVLMRVRNATSREFPLTGTYHHSDMAAFRHVAAFQVRLQCLDPGPTAFAGFTDLKAPVSAAGVIVGNPRISSTKTVLAPGEELTSPLPLRFFNTLPVGRYALTVTCVPQRGLGRVQYASYEFRIVAQPPEALIPAVVTWSFTPPPVIATVPKLLPIADPERRAVVWALALGAKVQILVNGVPSDPRNMPADGPFTVRSIDFFENGNHNEGRRMITDAEVANLAGLKEINHLRLPFTQITDIGLKEIGTLTSLRALDLNEAKITDAGLTKLAALNEVTSLRLNGTLITNAGVSRIVSLFPKVSEPLDLNDTNVSDAGIAHLKDAGFLRYVGLNGTDVGDRGVAQLAAIPRVAGVQLIGSRVTAAGVAQLKAAASQRDLRLDIGWDPAKVKTGPMVAVAVTAPAAVPLAVPAATPSATPTKSAAKTSTPATAPAPAPMPSPVDTRAPVPDTRAQQTALQLIKEVYKEDYTAAKTPEKKTELADKLLEQAQQTAEATERYVLLNEARTFAVDGDNQGLLLRILAATAEVYDVDAVTLHIDTWKAVLAKPRPAAMVREIYDEAGNRLETAVARGEFDDAKRFGDYALSIAPRIGDATAVKATRDRNTSLVARQHEWTTASNALITLSESPDDAAANLIVGRYRALVEEDWPSAFPLLAKGSDESWKELAGKSTTVGEDGTARAALADSFWDASKSKPALKAELSAAALFWYQAALPALNGLQKVRVEKRIAEVTVLVPPRKLPPTPLTAATTP